MLKKYNRRELNVHKDKIILKLIGDSSVGPFAQLVPPTLLNQFSQFVQFI